MSEVDNEADNEFFNRADEHINLSNKQVKEKDYGKVNASMLYSTARFSAYFSALGFNNAEEMEAAKEETIAYFKNEFAIMLEENLEEYIENFEEYKQT